MEVHKMSEDGENILKFVKEIRKLCNKISLLLVTIDEQMGSKGWEKAGVKNKNTAIADSSASVETPERWFPETIFRFYINTKYPNILVFVSILLDDIEYWAKYPVEIKEPLITAGYFDNGINNKVDTWEYNYAKLYGYMENRIDDGRVYESKENWQEDWDDECTFQSYKCFGIPLISMTNASEIEFKIIKPLVELIPK
jgi:hypothetical protein